jgi:hypothetical protein
MLSVSKSASLFLSSSQCEKIWRNKKGIKRRGEKDIKGLNKHRERDISLVLPSTCLKGEDG